MVISDDWFLDENSCEIVVAVHKIGHGRMERSGKTPDRIQGSLTRPPQICGTDQQ